MRWIRMLLSVLFLCLCFSGCGYRELQERILIQAIGVDQTREGYQVTVRAADPGEEGDEVFTCQGMSVLEALSNLSLSTGREPFYAHNYLVVFGRSCGEAGLDSAMDFFVRYYTTRPSVQVYLAAGEAEEILDPDENPPSMETLRRLNQGGEYTGKAASVDILEFVNAAKREGSSPVLPVIGLDEGRPVLQGTAIFKDYQLADILTLEETRGYLALKGGLHQGELVVEGEKFGTVTLTISSCHTKREVTFQEGLPVFKTVCQVTADVSSLSGERASLEESFIGWVEQAVEETLEEEMAAALEQSIFQDRCDIFGFGTLLYQQSPKQWESIRDNWEGVLPQCQYPVEVKATVLRMEQGGLR